MNGPDVQSLVIGVLQGLLTTTGFLLALFIGFSILFGFPKLRPSGRGSRVVRSVEERFGQAVQYLPPDAPRGRVDQLHTPELEEARARKSG